MPLEREVDFEGYAGAERLPFTLPWAVYRAVDDASGRYVRLAVLWAPEHVDAERRRAALDRFAEAGYQAQRLASPLASTVLAYRATDDVAFVATDYPAGRSLREILASDGPLAVPRALEIAARIAGALAQAHASGWAHAWLTSDTVWLDPEDRITLLDMGLGLAIPPLTAGMAAPYVTRPGFLSPDPRRLDMQCFGLLLTEMLVGRLPDPVGVPRLVIFPPDLPDGTARRIHTLIDPHAEDAPSAAEWAKWSASGGAESDGSDGKEMPTAEAIYEPEISWRERNRRWIPIGAGALLLVLLGVAFTSSPALRDALPGGTSAVTSPPPTATAPAGDAEEPLTKVQVGPLAAGEVDGVNRRLEGMGFTPYVVREGATTYLQVGAFANPDSAVETRLRLERANLPVRVK